MKSIFTKVIAVASAVVATEVTGVRKQINRAVLNAKSVEERQKEIAKERAEEDETFKQDRVLMQERQKEIAGDRVVGRDVRLESYEQFQARNRHRPALGLSHFDNMLLRKIIEKEIAETSILKPPLEASPSSTILSLEAEQVQAEQKSNGATI